MDGKWLNFLAMYTKVYLINLIIIYLQDLIQDSWIFSANEQSKMVLLFFFLCCNVWRTLNKVNIIKCCKKEHVIRSFFVPTFKSLSLYIHVHMCVCVCVWLHGWMCGWVGAEEKKWTVRDNTARWDKSPRSVTWLLLLACL